MTCFWIEFELTLVSWLYSIALFAAVENEHFERTRMIIESTNVDVNRFKIKREQITTTIYLNLILLIILVPIRMGSLHWI